MKRLYFGTDGVRGPYGGPLINEAFASRLAVAVGRWIRATSGNTPPLVLLGRDTRASGVSLNKALLAGFASTGAVTRCLGIAPTPAVAAAVVREGAALGVMITASHNPATDNGIKFFNARGMKLTDAEEAAIEALLPNEAVPPVASFSDEDLANAPFCEAAVRSLPLGSLNRWRIVLDTAHGATCETSAKVLRTLGAELVQLGAAPDGYNINAGCGSEHPEALAAEVRRQAARLGIAHDGDGDRCVLCDETGSILDGDEVMAILATHALKLGKLRQNTLVATVQSNLGLDAAVRAAGGHVVRTQVGDRYVLEGLLATGATLGGESSGHIVALESATTGDGLCAALKVLEVMTTTSVPLSELRRVMRKFPQAQRALRVAQKLEIETLGCLPTAIRSVEKALGSEGRVLVRYSGTEAKLRLLVEGPDDEAVSTAMIQLVSAARSDLTVLDSD